MNDPHLLFDIGGSRTRLAVSHDLESFEEPFIMDTPKNFDKAVEAIAAKTLRLCGGSVARAAGGIAGTLNREKTGLGRAPNLKGWEGRDFAGELSKKINSPVHIENDTAIVGLGEAVYGPGRGHDIVVYITISTGVNGAKISGQKIDENVFGFEVGHQIIDFDNSQGIGSTKRGTLEDFISGRETEKRYGTAPKEIEEEGIWERYAEWASYGVYNTILHWSPEIVIFGGSMMNDIKVADIEKHAKALLEDVYPASPRFAKAALGNVGGLWGALHYLKSLK